MLPDSNSLSTLGYQFFLGSVSGDWIILGLIVLFVLTIVLVLAKARASTAIISFVSVIFVFSLLEPAFFFMFWVALVMVGILFVNGLRKKFTGQ